MKKANGSLQQLGKAKSHCAVGIEWAADGLTMMTAVLYERVKVDNMVTLFHATGNKLLKDKAMGHIHPLHSCQWQPFGKGVFKVPNISELEYSSPAITQQK